MIPWTPCQLISSSPGAHSCHSLFMRFENANMLAIFLDVAAEQRCILSMRFRSCMAPEPTSSFTSVSQMIAHVLEDGRKKQENPT